VRSKVLSFFDGTSLSFSGLQKAFLCAGDLLMLLAILSLLPLFLSSRSDSKDECTAVDNWPKPLKNIQSEHKKLFRIVDFSGEKGRGLVATERTGEDSVFRYEGDLMLDDDYHGGSKHALQISGIRAQWYVEELSNGKTRLWDYKSFTNYSSAFVSQDSFHEIWIVDPAVDAADGLASYASLINMADSVWALRAGKKNVERAASEDGLVGHCRLLGGFTIDDDGDFRWNAGWVWVYRALDKGEEPVVADYGSEFNYGNSEDPHEEETYGST
jgi:hypothetical protein